MADISPDPGLAANAAFDRAYQVLIEAWPTPVTSARVPTAYGPTHVLAAGDESDPVVLLLPGGGATAAVWFAVAAPLSRQHRVIAVDPIGQPGWSSPGERPLGDVAALGDWLDQLLAGLAIERATLAGHSYGAWMALRYGLHAPERVEGLVLIDPTDCFLPMRLPYRLRAVPLFARPSGARLRRFLSWETGGRRLSPEWLSVAALGADLGRLAIVTPRCPTAEELALLDAPTLVVAAGRSQAHDPARMLRRAAERLPKAAHAVLADATHHTLPTEDADQLVAAIEAFLVPS
jgi:pimeloyl-ACP methyl ester carboxylesterase